MDKFGPTFLGSIFLNSKVIAIDPCYESKKDGLILDMDFGLFEAYVLTGKLKKPLFRWDEHPSSFRVFEVLILKEGLSLDPKSFKEAGYIGVDSGQAGFFNLNSYKKDLDFEVPLHGDQESFFRESIISDYMKIKDEKNMIKTKNEMYQKLLKSVFKGDEKRLLEFSKQEIKMREGSIKRSKEILKTKKFPSYIELETSKDFYKVMCSKTSEENGAGIVDQVGVVASSGIGDGGYTVFTSTKNGKVQGAYISFLPLSEMK